MFKAYEEFLNNSFYQFLTKITNSGRFQTLLGIVPRRYTSNQSGDLALNFASGLL